MARRGRKRKWRGSRLPGTNAPAIERAPDDRMRAARQPHRRGLPEHDRLSEKAESPLGRLNLRGVITEEQYEAGLRYAVVVGEYRAVIEAPRQMSGSGRGFSCWADAVCNAEPEKCICRLRYSRYDFAFGAVMDAGQRAAKAVSRVAVFREEIAPADVEDLRAGLVNLARHFGLTGRRGKCSIR